MLRTPSCFVLALLVSSFAFAEGNVSPDAADVVAKVGRAYSKLKTLDLAGRLSGEFDVDGQKDSQHVDFTSSFAAPNQFRRDVSDDVSVGSTGQKLYFYAKNHRLYTTSDAPKGKVLGSELPDPFPTYLGIAESTDPSLALALSSDPAGELAKSYPNMSRADDVTIDGKGFTALKLSREKDSPAMTLLIDPATNLIRRALIEVPEQFKTRGASDVKKALLTVDYTTTRADAALKPETFAWSPPPGAKDAEEIASGDEEDSEAAKTLVGNPAPDFTLKDVDDKEVKLSDFKGSVVVLDFWASWCGPCMVSMPKLEKLYEEKKEQGLKVLAINQGEDAQLVQGFAKSKNLSVRVLVDADEKINKMYKAEFIPETVVISKDGTVRKVFISALPETEKKIREAVEAALKAPN